ncbi:hypothetical protein LJR129_004936 [Acidovorax sp. LjRoot129]|uniref:hypothetical protein n=1 Tax=unclassified Acidovorax TaxID=2684926 RepID=UPI003ED11A04
MQAADVFAPPAAAVPSVSAEQESRIARLEASLASAIEKIGKSNDSVKPPDSGIKLSDPLPLPLPSKGSAPGSFVIAKTSTELVKEQERVLGVMNDFEIYVYEGVVRKRPAEASTLTLPKIAGGGK